MSIIFHRFFGLLFLWSLALTGVAQLVSIPISGAVVVKGTSVDCGVVDVVLECGEVRAWACVVGRELSTFQYERTGR